MSIERKDTQENTESENITSQIINSRRKFLIAAGIGLGVIAAKSVINIGETAENTDFEITIDGQKLDESIPLPQSRIIEDEVFIKPTGLEMNDEQFRDLANELKIDVNRILSEALFKALSNGPQQSQATVEKFIYTIEQLIAMRDRSGAAASALGSFERERTRGPIERLENINHYLNPANLHLDLAFDSDKSVKIVPYDIKRSHYISISDTERETTIPVIHLGEPQVPNGYLESQFRIFNKGSSSERRLELPKTSKMFYHPVSKKVFVFDHDIELWFRIKLQELSNSSAEYDFIDWVDVERRYIEGAIHHEAIHGLLGTEHTQEGHVKRNVPFEINWGERSFDFTDEYSLAELHEACGIGAELQKTDVREIPLVLETYLRSSFYKLGGERALPSYRLTQKILPYLVLFYAPKTKETEEAKEKLKDTQKTGYQELRKVIQAAEFNLKHTHRIGDTLYRIGKMILQRNKRKDFKNIA